MPERVERFSVLPGGPRIWVRYSDYERQEKVAARVREVESQLALADEGWKKAEDERDQAKVQALAELREGLLSDDVARRVWEADRDSGWKLLKGVTYRDRLQAAVQAALSTLDQDEAEFSCRGIEAKYIEDESKRLGIECDKPPPGWRCTRPKGREGPCAALPLDQEGEGDG